MAPSASTKYTAVDLEDKVDEEKKNDDVAAVVELLDEDLVKPDHVVGSKTKSSRRSWLRILLWTIGICVAVLVLVAVATATGAYLWMRHQVQRFTVVRNDQQHSVEQQIDNPISRVELDIALDRAKLFWDELRAGHEPEQDLVITQDQLNSAIAQDRHLNGKGFVEISDGKFNLDLAVPADPLPGGRGRIFVGSASVEETVSDERMSSILAQLLPEHKIRGLDFDTILRGEFSVLYPSPMGDPLKVILQRGQFLNWIVPEDWIKERNNLWSCEWMDDNHHHGCDRHGHHHDHDGRHGGRDHDDDDHDHHHGGHHGHDHHDGHHHGHHHDDDDDDDHHHHNHGNHHLRRILHGHHGHGHHGHHHHEDDKQVCQEVIAAFNRLESIRLEKGQIVFTPKRSTWKAIDTVVTDFAPADDKAASSSSLYGYTTSIEDRTTNSDNNDESDSESEDEDNSSNDESGIRGRRRLFDEGTSSSSPSWSKMHGKLARRVLRSLFA